MDRLRGSRASPPGIRVSRGARSHRSSRRPRRRRGPVPCGGRAAAAGTAPSARRCGEAVGRCSRSTPCGDVPCVFPLHRHHERDEINEWRIGETRGYSSSDSARRDNSRGFLRLGSRRPTKPPASTNTLITLPRPTQPTDIHKERPRSRSERSRPLNRACVTHCTLYSTPRRSAIASASSTVAQCATPYQSRVTRSGITPTTSPPTTFTVDASFQMS